MFCVFFWSTVGLLFFLFNSFLIDERKWWRYLIKDAWLKMLYWGCLICIAYWICWKCFEPCLRSMFNLQIKTPFALFIILSSNKFQLKISKCIEDFLFCKVTSAINQTKYDFFSTRRTYQISRRLLCKFIVFVVIYTISLMNQLAINCLFSSLSVWWWLSAFLLKFIEFILIMFIYQRARTISYFSFFRI